MPRLSVYYIRASLVYLALGFTFGGLLLANKGVMFLPAIWAFLPIHIEFSFVGWMVQLAMGVAFWILPRFPVQPIRGDERLSWLAFFMMNLGIWFIVLQIATQVEWLTFIGRVLELLGVGLFAVGNWKRIKPLGS
ncbi:MAG: hypothetical protein KJZ72_14115 [Anaerolineales bacterium]|jgi:hypothetical protein|nr:hypothetical protein [Anaerolineales bacterium]